MPVVWAGVQRRRHAVSERGSWATGSGTGGVGLSALEGDSEPPSTKIGPRGYLRKALSLSRRESNSKNLTDRIVGGPWPSQDKAAAS